MQILVVEDEKAVRQYLQDSLSPQGYAVQSLASLDELETLLLQPNAPRPDAVILDRLLNGHDSAPLIQKIRTHWGAAAIIVLSAIGGPAEKGRVLDYGADDYLNKPFSIEELSARLRALLRRKDVVKETGFHLGNTRINLASQVVEVNGKRVDLSRKEFLVLTTLIQSPARVFNKYQLLDHVWDVHTDVESNVVEVTIKNLRRKLEGAEASAQILSKRNVGYWIEG